MKKDTIDHILSYIFKYVWLLCAFILIVEVFTTVSTSKIFMENTTQDMMTSTKKEIENKLDVTLKLAEALSKDYRLSDTTISLVERGKLLKPYADVYNLFLIGLTDEKGVIVSSFDDIPGDISSRDYFQQILTSKQTVITDVIIAGADGVTKNYTLCVPMLNEEGNVKGTILMAIYYDELNDIVTRTLSEEAFRFSIMDSQNIIISDANTSLVDQSFLEVEGNSYIFSNSAEKINQSILNKEEGSYWVFYDGILQYIRYAPLTQTNWSLNIQTDVLLIIQPILIQFTIKSISYIAIFSFISYFGRKYTNKKLKDVNSLIKQVTTLQYELQSQQILSSNEISEYIELSKKGLVDQLTNLPTRSVFLKQQKLAFSMVDINQKFVLISVDLDNLKQLNDVYGHNVGDAALVYVGECLLELYHSNESLVCRYGGDEFLAYVPFSSQEELILILGSLNDKLHTTLLIGNQEIPIHSSIGAAIYPKHGKTFEDLYKNADLALYFIKQNGRGNYHIFNEKADEIIQTSHEENTK